MALAVATPPHALQGYPLCDSPAFQEDLAAKGEETLGNGAEVRRPVVRKMSSLMDKKKALLQRKKSSVERQHEVHKQELEEKKVLRRRMSQIGFEEIDPNTIVFGQLLGEGAMGRVFEASWNGRPVAAKTFKGKGAQDDFDRNSIFGQDLCQELDVLYSVGNHPSIVSFYGAVTRSKPCLLLELVKGPTLDEYLHGGGFNLHVNPHVATVAGWTRDMLSGINFMHDRDPYIIHRDLKPANMILTADLNKLKLLDFGVGKLASKKNRMLKQHTLCTGTNRYMAPEVFSEGERPYTEKADIYSAGLVIWEIATGRKPFDANGEVRYLMQPSMRQIMRPSTADMSWQELAPLLHAAWNSEPNERPSAKELLVMLNATPKCPVEGVDSSPILYVDKSLLQSPQCQCSVS